MRRQIRFVIPAARAGGTLLDFLVARFTYHMTLASGEKVDARGLTYYRLANGKIVEDDPITSPELSTLLGSAAPTAVAAAVRR